MARITELVKTYKMINDPEAPQWSVRFVGAILIVAVVAAAAGFLFVTYSDRDASALSAAAPQDDASGPAAGAGLAPTVERIVAPGAVPGVPVDLSGAAAEALDAWKAAHPGADVVSETPILDGGRIVGYEISYR